ncbi:MAG: hypothetical protein USCGTAYLOR_00158 [Chromatiales bacterium USCg_Taylor]|nr:MAG: hypothetical protein USCGTAYLOR_00158 [Chromatiales bacterium USCg_Taylor]
MDYALFLLVTWLVIVILAPTVRYLGKIVADWLLPEEPRVPNHTKEKIIC